jgi:hypothetical protein
VWSVLNKNRVPSCVREVLDGTVHDDHTILGLSAATLDAST